MSEIDYHVWIRLSHIASVSRKPLMCLIRGLAAVYRAALRTRKAGQGRQCLGKLALRRRRRPGNQNKKQHASYNQGNEEYLHL